MKEPIEDVLLYFALKYEGNFHDCFDALENKERVDEKEFDELKKSIHHSYTTIMSEDYPEYLKEDYNPPMVIFYKGDLKLMDDPDAERHVDYLADGTKLVGAMKAGFVRGRPVVEMVVGCERHDNLDVALQILEKQKGQEIRKGRNEIIH